MDTLVHADIFFFVTTIAVVGVALALIVALLYLAAILRRVSKVMDEVNKETILVRQDIQTLRENVKSGGAKLKFFGDFFQNIFTMKSSRSTKKKG